MTVCYVYFCFEIPYYEDLNILQQCEKYDIIKTTMWNFRRLRQ